ncbi:uncharacterized protein nw isoform X1 [Neodiprion pinetum]|uniref:uncharacterized protein LOC124186892 isoform X1 n=1 Tax=Neodiprion fabricii TaxID=2872261 RepID=UPI001ED92F54|nr:uncharacterized protein LOC124186892 isoform X1 [Neodiprion fabricii]XP_046491564.1 uncharacterized protein LOC124223544 isoform X1 [Neodiprion pinetum]
MKIALFLIIAAAACTSAQRITTIQLDGVQYYVSRMNPYSLELNYFLAYQYCRSLGLQLISFETKEKADTMTQYLQNAGYTKFDFWTSGNKLGTDMMLWMSTGLPFNSTFDYMRKLPGRSETYVPRGTEPQRIARESGENGSADLCVVMKAPTLEWVTEDCTLFKDFICEQTRCYYYNYGSIPVSATQGNRRPYTTTTTAAPAAVEDKIEDKAITEENASTSDTESEEKVSEDPIVNRLVTAVPASASTSDFDPNTETSERISKSDIVEDQGEEDDEDMASAEKHTGPDHIPDIASLFATRKDPAFDGLETREVRPASAQAENSEDYEVAETELPNNALEDARTIGPYDNSQQDYVNDQPIQDEPGAPLKQLDDDSSTILPEAEPGYRYNIKVRSNGKVLDPPSN